MQCTPGWLAIHTKSGERNLLYALLEGTQKQANISFTFALVTKRFGQTTSSNKISPQKTGLVLLFYLSETPKDLKETWICQITSK